MSRRSRKYPSSKYRSGFEEEVSKLLPKEFKYESEKMEYNIPRTYTPDFVHESGVYLELKGYFRDGDTQKYKAIRDCLPADHELIFVLMKPEQKVRKGSKLTMSGWCEKEGIRWYTSETLDELVIHVALKEARRVHAG